MVPASVHIFFLCLFTICHPYSLNEDILVQEVKSLLKCWVGTWQLRDLSPGARIPGIFPLHYAQGAWPRQRSQYSGLDTPLASWFGVAFKSSWASVSSGGVDILTLLKLYILRKWYQCKACAKTHSSDLLCLCVGCYRHPFWALAHLLLLFSIFLTHPSPVPLALWWASRHLQRGLCAWN